MNSRIMQTGILIGMLVCAGALTAAPEKEKEIVIVEKSNVPSGFVWRTSWFGFGVDIPVVKTLKDSMWLSRYFVVASALYALADQKSRLALPAQLLVVPCLLAIDKIPTVLSIAWDALLDTPEKLRAFCSAFKLRSNDNDTTALHFGSVLVMAVFLVDYWALPVAGYLYNKIPNPSDVSAQMWQRLKEKMGGKKPQPQTTSLATDEEEIDNE
jgi:hypothetical protein